ncbi:hypothetical protein [Mycoplasmopsis gallopavonis]|uniref:Uncharacterized protein n=1 Tax=Mycoplasmopsis gallopavonis TaxID=76629 RepID=A0A449AZ72_9BACT|nr:hypothetical protein [Mycoplasmopsis gallopavonis]RIV16823.1 hypothetical protein D1113_00840 [Mycoplasmopsis gallopavonis]VEU72810.1 Uncharacterised protein [Mycoplasmopsis gallopavonis]
MFPNLIYSEPNEYYRVYFENKWFAKNQSFEGQVEVNDDPTLRSYFRRNNFNITIGVTRILGGRKLVDLDIFLKSNYQIENNTVSLFINEKALIERQKLKKHTIINHHQADIPFDKIKRIDLHYYYPLNPKRILAKYTILFSEFKVPKLKINNYYRYNLISFDSCHSFEFQGNNFLVHSYPSYVKVIWPEFSSSKYTKKVAQLQLYNSHRYELEDPKKPETFIQINPLSFSIKPFLSDKFNLNSELDHITSTKLTQKWNLEISENLSPTPDLNNLQIDSDRTISRGILLPSKFNKEMTANMVLESNFFIANISYNFENDLANNIEPTHNIEKYREVVIEELSNPALVDYYNFVINLENYNKYAEFNEWELAWFIKKDRAYLAKWD